MKKIAAAFFVLFLPCFIFAQNVGKVSLLVSNCKVGESACYTKQLFRYDFVDGEFTGKEEITSSQDLIFDEWRDRVYRDRYVVTSAGSVIDITQKKILHIGTGELHRIVDDKVYIRGTGVNENGLFAFDLQTGKYERVKRADKHMFFGKLSPNGTRTAKYWCQTNKRCGFEIAEYGKQRFFLEYETGSIKTADLSSSEFWNPPIYWLDEERFLTQKNNGELVIISVKGKVTPFLNIKIDKYPYSNPRIYLTPDNQLIYNCVYQFELDVENKTYRQIDGIVGNGFTIKDNQTVKSNWGTGKIFYHNETEIGRLWTSTARSIPDYLAVVYGKDGSNLGYPDGVKVWNNLKKGWSTFEISWNAEILGWIH